MGRTFAQLPGYEVLARIGRGAGAVIYEGRRPPSRERLAIKHVVRHGPQDDRFVEQAENEHEVTRRFDHPALRKSLEIVHVRRWLKLTELYLILEYVDGVRLEDNPPTAVPAMIRVFTEIAQGLHHVHAHGFAHADIKPNNILLQKGGGLKIIDFGQSCPLGHTKARIQGTPDYMAPEQALRQPIDQRTDVFNLGATMYWVATGKWFKTLMNRGETGMKKIEVDARSDSAPPCELNPEVPPTLSQLIMDCCATRREDRPRDMKVVVSRLDTIAQLGQHRPRRSTGSTMRR